MKASDLSCPVCGSRRVRSLGLTSESLTFSRHGENVFLGIQTYNCLECGFILRFRGTEHQMYLDKIEGKEDED